MGISHGVSDEDEDEEGFPSPPGPGLPIRDQ